LGIADLIASFASQAHASSEKVYYHNDALGSPVAATDSSGKVLWKEEYEPYGGRILNVDNGQNDLWFTGKPDEADFGWAYFGARWYDPKIGQFIAPDPKRFEEANISTFNRYAYASDNPLKFVDPDGKKVQLVQEPSPYDNKIYPLTATDRVLFVMAIGYIENSPTGINVLDMVKKLDVNITKSLLPPTSFGDTPDNLVKEPRIFGLVNGEAHVGIDFDKIEGANLSLSEKAKILAHTIVHELKHAVADITHNGKIHDDLDKHGEADPDVIQFDNEIHPPEMTPIDH
jgi:RHS repeat-associated protein